jgi:hypothetical protein
MTASQRAAGREAVRTAPARYSGKIPRRVRRRSPAALAGYELPLALMGFPGVGWLFAGFPLAASILLMVGPATAWAGVPLLFSPYGGPLRGVGWKIEFVYLAVSALLSAAFALPRACAPARAARRHAAGRTSPPQNDVLPQAGGDRRRRHRAVPGLAAVRSGGCGNRHQRRALRVPDVPAP